MIVNMACNIYVLGQMCENKFAQNTGVLRNFCGFSMFSNILIFFALILSWVVLDLYFFDL
jgi:hypothetical protein